MKEVKVKVGDLRKDAAGSDYVWEVTAIGKKKLLARGWSNGEVVHDEESYMRGEFEDEFSVVLDEHGNPVDPEPAGERRCEIDWNGGRGTYGPNVYYVTEAPGFDDFTAFESKGGSRCSSSPYWWEISGASIKQPAATTAMSKQYRDWCKDLGYTVTKVRAVRVILEAKP